MNKTFSILITILLFTTIGFAQDVTGLWKTVDDVTGETKSVVEIYKENGKFYGKIKEILNKDRQDAKCDKCPGEDFGKPVLGLVFLKGLVKDGDEYNDGKILDPENGKLYKCYIELEEANKLKVRGYIGFALIGRTQYWYRVQ